MAILGWLAVAAVGGLITKEIKNSRERAAEEERRKSTLCYFNDGISHEQFEAIVKKAGKHIKRLKELTVDGPVVYGTVRTQSGLSDWYFKADFNDYGHITGTYWLSSDNDDSNIPKHVADNISSMIQSFPEGFQEEREKARQSDNGKDNGKNAAAGNRYCPYCGRPVVTTGAKYCSYCGKKV